MRERRIMRKSAQRTRSRKLVLLYVKKAELPQASGKIGQMGGDTRRRFNRIVVSELGVSCNWVAKIQHQVKLCGPLLTGWLFPSPHIFYDHIENA
jgi:hypothetical protein